MTTKLTPSVVHHPYFSTWPVSFVHFLVCSQNFSYTSGDKDGTPCPWSNLGGSYWYVSNTCGGIILELVGRFLLSRKWKGTSSESVALDMSLFTNTFGFCRWKFSSSDYRAPTVTSCAVPLQGWQTLTSAPSPGLTDKVAWGVAVDSNWDAARLHVLFLSRWCCETSWVQGEMGTDLE